METNERYLLFAESNDILEQHTKKTFLSYNCILQSVWNNVTLKRKQVRNVTDSKIQIENGLFLFTSFKTGMPFQSIEDEYYIVDVQAS